MNRAENKAQRLMQIEVLLIDHPEGLTLSQIAQRIDVHRTTVMRNLADMTAPVYSDHGRYFIDRQSYLVNLRLNLHEALSIHLAGRLMATRLDRQNPHMAAAFRKLGIALETLAPQFSNVIRDSANTFDDDSKRNDPKFLHILETLTDAWAKSRKVRIGYRSAEKGLLKEHLFSLYYIEAGAVGQSIYVIGLIEPENEKRTYKAERIETIAMTDEPFTIPEDFHSTALLSQAWGIWFTDREPVRVILRFSEKAAKRICETRWHPSEKTSLQSDGSLLWQAEISEPREMLPWIFGWGSQVEVIEPADLRDYVAADLRKAVKIYGKEEENDG
jgi:CRISPR-associated endonuclease/helicase Cas3